MQPLRSPYLYTLEGGPIWTPSYVITLGDCFSNRLTFYIIHSIIIQVPPLLTGECCSRRSDNNFHQSIPIYTLLDIYSKMAQAILDVYIDVNEDKFQKHEELPTMR